MLEAHAKQRTLLHARKHAQNAHSTVFAVQGGKPCNQSLHRMAVWVWVCTRACVCVCVYALLRVRESAWEFLLSPFRGVASCTAPLAEASWRGRACASLLSPRRLFGLLTSRVYPHHPTPDSTSSSSTTTTTAIPAPPHTHQPPSRPLSENKFGIQACHNSS